MMRSGAIKGAGPFFSGREPDVPAIQSYPMPKQIYLNVIPPTGNSEEAFFATRISFEYLSCTDSLLCPSCRRCGDARAIARTMDLAKRDCVEHAERTRKGDRPARSHRRGCPGPNRLEEKGDHQMPRHHHFASAAFRLA